MLTILAVLMFLYLLVRAVPAMVAANGHRPFLVGYIALTLLLGWGALEAGFVGAPMSQEIRRLLVAGTLVGTFEWAGRHR
ncbi:MAG: hypothetical protein HY873_13145 [Chloroflexi bacterium]|nr:hypothetical protein [Chloroflexota bacterium]